MTPGAIEEMRDFLLSGDVRLNCQLGSPKVVPDKRASRAWGLHSPEALFFLAYVVSRGELLKHTPASCMSNYENDTGLSVQRFHDLE